jgi:uncharacterized membrane protein
MVLEFKVPTDTTFEALVPLFQKFLSYGLSFVFVWVYWNHHHMMPMVKHVNGNIIWANLHLLFCLSLIPFATAWIGEHHFALFPMILCGMILLVNAIAYFILQSFILKHHGKDSNYIKP